MTTPFPSSPPPCPVRAPSPFGRARCAMVTPSTPAGAPGLDGAARLAGHLVSRGCDGLVPSGTPGESPTTTDAGKSALVTAVREAVGGRAAIVAGVGTAGTAHTAGLAREAEKAGADGLPGTVTTKALGLPAGPVRRPLGP
ncbi:dihydrodipicolinate synthase family protein, partial [Streptomyces sp. NPDC057433]|uniref:dihydrodipicolinate synthase family protein n=1 Tax=Streptomyces sp. NPDC057433 TaxID=3346132 RepID=UPI0036AD3124